MRFASIAAGSRAALATSFLLLAGIGGTGASIFATSCASVEHHDVEGEEEMRATENGLGLRLTFDEKTSTIQATAEEALAPGEDLRLRVRRGRLSSDSRRPVDCFALDVAPPIPGRKVPTRAGLRAVHQGPEVDISLLANVYSAEWIRSHLQPEVLDQIARQGGDTIVEACIVSGEQVRARVQTSVALAWDENDPNLAVEIDRR